ncbi:MAG: hypothetical protein U0441_10390 [Polyangiaceae bacterium]
MKRTSSWVRGEVVLGLFTVSFIAAAAGCGGTDTNSGSKGGNGGVGGGMGATGGIIGGGNQGGTGGTGGITPSDLCGPGVPDCKQTNEGPTGMPPSSFPMPPDPDVTADGVSVDENGYIGLDIQKKQSDYLWVANDMNYGMGLVSKISTKPFPSAPAYREVARYPTFTCQSDAVNGSREGLVLSQNPPGPLCSNGVNGCCSRAESTPGPNGGHQAINVIQNRPSRTAVDFNGDMWVANRAFGYQQSVTKIAGDASRCIDRNGNGKIDTSADVNGDGIITTDCNEDNLPDDAATACNAGLAHEFYGLDDECVLFTVNYGEPNSYGRSLALAPADEDVYPPKPSNAWVGTWTNGMFYKINGETGAIMATVQIQPQGGVPANPYGAAIDRYGILWAPNEGNFQLFYFNTKDPTQQGMVQVPLGGGGFYGIAVDGYTPPGANAQIQQIWMGEVGNAGAYRYRPVRDQGFAGLATGTWAHAVFDGPGNAPQGRGIGVDNRQPQSFAWVALDGYVSGSNGGIGRIPVDMPDNVNNYMAPDTVMSTGQVGTLGAGVASNLDIWGINQGTSSATHFAVDANGLLVGQPDTVPLDDKPNAPETFCGQGQCKPHPYTYSDFTGFGLVNFTNPKGYYSLIQKGCGNGQLTRWYAVKWDSDQPAGTAITMVARSAATVADLKNAVFTGQYMASPADLQASPGPLDPNPADYIEVQFVLTTTNDSSPKLKSFSIAFACEDKNPN